MANPSRDVRLKGLLIIEAQCRKCKTHHSQLSDTIQEYLDSSNARNHLACEGGWSAGAPVYGEVFTESQMAGKSTRKSE